MDGVVAYILGKSYTKKSLIGIGALAGAPCEVQSVNKVGKTTTVTLQWQDTVGGIHTQSFDIEDGLDGVSVTGATIDSSGDLILTLSDGTPINCGKVLPQYDTMPSPSSSNVGQILQYIGTTTTNYTNGYFYKCVNDGGVYKWQYINVQDSYTKNEIGDLTNLPDNTKNIVQNIGELNLSINQLSGSVFSALSNKENIFRFSTLPTPTSSNVGSIVQYIGDTTSTLTKGYFYECQEVSTGVYNWVQKNVQPSNGGTGGDGVVDGYYNDTDHLFYEENTYINPISGDNNTLYVSLDTNLLYRYNGIIFIRVDESTIGEDDVIDGYYNTTNHKFYEEPTYITEITGETGKIYISDDTNIQYRWDGTQFITISSSITVDNALSTTSENPVQNKVITLELNQLQGSLLNKVDKETGKGLSTNDFTTAEKDKLRDLASIYLIGSGLTLNPNNGELSATGISIQVDPTLDKTSTHPIQNQAVANAIDQLQTDKLSISDIDNALSTTSENPVQNKVIALTIDQLQSSVLGKMQKMLSANADDFAIFDSNGQVVDSNISKDIVPSTASASNKLLVNSDISSKANKPSISTSGDLAELNASGDLVDSGKKLSDLQDKLTQGAGINLVSNTISVDTTYLTASRLGFIPTTEKGSNNGVAELDSAGKVPSSQLPSYVDDVIEGYLYNGDFYQDASHTILITPESSKIYVDLTDDTVYRWSGSIYVQIAEGLALGVTHSTAYYGDYGNTAYQHSQIINGSNPHNTKANTINLNVPISALSGSNTDVESTLYGINTILGDKADKVSGATNDDIALLDSNGNLKDSYKSLSDYQEKLTKGNGIDITSNVISVDVSYLTASRLGFIPTTEKGASNGVATLVSGKIPSTQLPSYVDDVIEGYYNPTDQKFYEESTYTTQIIGETGKIYVSLDTNKTYRWTGSAFVEISAGETYTQGAGIDISSGVISVDEMPYADISDVVDPLPIPLSSFMGNPTGCIIQMMGVTAPLGYLECDGSVYNISSYSTLADYFISQFGISNYFGGDGVYTFAVPDLRGEFLRGTGTNSHTNQGNGANVGIHQDATNVPNLSVASNGIIFGQGSLSKSSTNDDGTISGYSTTYRYNGTSTTSGTRTDAPIDINMRPTNTSILYCIKY